MRASKVFAAVFAMSLGGSAVYALNHGLDTQVTINEPCKDKRLSYKDQTACAAEAQAAANKEARGEVFARYTAKADAVQNISTNFGPAPTKTWTPGGKPHVTTRQL